MKMFNAVKAKNDCVQWIKDWFDENGKDCNAVIGISGGKDSSVVAALCVEALGKNRVIGVLMPNGFQKDIHDSIKIVEHLDIKYTIVNIKEAFEGIISRIEDMFVPERDGYEEINISEQTKINLPPRLRMATLYAISQSVNGRVIGTDNASEAYIGYSTRWGDNVADAMPILNFTSDEVIAIGDVLGLPYELTHKTPSDGLCGKTDEDNFGFTYDVLNKYILTGECENEVIKSKIDNLHNKNLFKTQPIPSFVPTGVRNYEE
jgi:NAD+ synthase